MTLNTILVLSIGNNKVRFFKVTSPLKAYISCLNFKKDKRFSTSIKI